MAAQLTADEKVRIRHHLDYLNTTETYALISGIPTAIEVQSWLEGAMNRVPIAALPQLQLLLARCDLTEEQMFNSQENHQVEKIGDITINPNEFGTLTERLRYWSGKMATLLGVVRNPISQTGGGGINAPVVSG